MTTSQIISQVKNPIVGLGPWRHSEVGRHRRIFRALASIERISAWSYITFPEWTWPQAQLLRKYLNDALMFSHWKSLRHAKLGDIIYYEPFLNFKRGPEQFKLPSTKYHYPFDQCTSKGHWFTVRNNHVGAIITNQNTPTRIFKYALDPDYGHIIYRAL